MFIHRAAAVDAGQGGMLSVCWSFLDIADRMTGWEINAKCTIITQPSDIDYVFIAWCCHTTVV